MTDQSKDYCRQPETPYKSISDPPATNCEPKPQFESCSGIENLHHAPDATFQGLDADSVYRKEGWGEADYCDPMTTGEMIDNDHELPPDHDVIYQFHQNTRGIDEAVKKLFMNIKLLDAAGKKFHVPLIWGPQEKAVQVILQSNVRKDNTGVVDKRVLPMMAISRSSWDFPRDRMLWHMAIDYKRGLRHYDKQGRLLGAPDGSPSWTHKEGVHRHDTVLGMSRGIPVDLGYTLTIWATFWQDMNQILHQIGLKFNPLAYINVHGVTNWESTAEITGVDNNLEVEPGDVAKRVYKFQVHIKAQSFLQQPLHKRKAVLKTRIEMEELRDDSEDVSCILSRIEEEIGDLEI